MNIGEKLKELREQNSLTRKEAADKLRAIGIAISDKTLYGYESGRNSANADMFLALCKIYGCNNVMSTFYNSVDDVLFTNQEWKLIEKYRDLDDHGKEMVDFVLAKEYVRSIKYNDQLLNAAHQRTDIDIPEGVDTSDDDIMDDDNF